MPFNEVYRRTTEQLRAAPYTADEKRAMYARGQYLICEGKHEGFRLVCRPDESIEYIDAHGRWIPPLHPSEVEARRKPFEGRVKDVFVEYARRCGKQAAARKLEELQRKGKHNDERRKR